MPDSGVPTWARHVLRATRIAAGAFAVLVGVGDVHSPSDVITRAAGPDFVAWWAWISVVAGAVVIAAVSLHRWRWELVASAILVVALSTRATAVWLTVDGGYRLAAAAGTSLAATLFFIRTVDLIVFGIKASAVPRARLRLRRRKVEQDGGV